MAKSIETKISYNRYLNEYTVKLFIDGEHQKDADYFTDDQEDANGTAELMKERAIKADENFMTIQDAFQIVYDLAEQNALDEHEAGEMGMQDEQKKQMLALNTVHDFLVNNIYK